MSVGAGGGLLAAVRSGRVCRLCSFVGCGVIGAALAVLVGSVCFWLAVLVGGVICGGGVLVGSSNGPGRH